MNSGIYKRNLLLPSVKIVIDFLVVVLAVVWSFYLRFYLFFTKIIPVRDNYIPPFENYIYFAIILGIIYIILFGIYRSYKSRISSTFPQEIPLVFKVNVLAILVTFTLAFFYRGFSYSRVVFILVFINTAILLLIGRYVFHRYRSRFISKGYNTIRVIIVGSEKIVSRVYHKIKEDRNYNFDMKGYVSSKHDKDLSIPYLGDFANIPSLLKNNDLDGVIVSFSHKEHDLILPVIQQTEGKNIEIFYVPDILDILTSNFNNLEVNGLPLLQLKSFMLSGWQGFIKRGFDIIISALALIVLSPLFFIIALLIILTSPGPVFYRQKRVTLDDEDFEMLKFRSMYVTETSKEGLIDVVRNDPRITPVGKFLRRTSADELPQLWNVLKGYMSLVGPRPERRYYVELNKKEIPRYSERHRVRTGITGWAQVNGLRQQDSMLVERIRYDLYYIENWSLAFDIKIILMTMMVIVRGENAY